MHSNHWKCALPDKEQLDKLTVHVVHKMKNNLGGIVGFASLLEREISEDPETVTLVRQIKGSALRLDELVLDLMTLIRDMPVTRDCQHLMPLLTQKIVQYEEAHDVRIAVRNQTRIAGKDLRLRGDMLYLDRLLNAVIAFIVKSEAVLTDVLIHEAAAGHITLDFSVENLPFIENESDDLTDVLNRYEPVEARLAFYVILKLMHQLNGTMEIIKNDVNRLTLRLTFDSEQVHG